MKLLKNVMYTLLVVAVLIFIWKVMDSSQSSSTDSVLIDDAMVQFLKDHPNPNVGEIVTSSLSEEQKEYLLKPLKE